MPYICPVCAYDKLVKPPVDFNICPCCATEFGYDDAQRSYEELRAEWVGNGAPWFSHAIPAPQGWSAARQLLREGYGLSSTTSSANTNVEEEVKLPVRPRWTSSVVCHA